MRLPIAIEVAGHIIDIEYVDHVLNDGNLVMGDSCYNDNKIRISKDQHKSYEAVLSTLKHEIIHIVLGKAGLTQLLTDDMEEAIVVALEQFGASLFNFDRSKWVGTTKFWGKL